MVGDKAWKQSHEPETFRCLSRFGGCFEARGRLPRINSNIDAGVPPAQHLREHFLTCGRIQRDPDGRRTEAVLPTKLHSDYKLLVQILGYERRSSHRHLWACCLFGQPTHKLRLGYHVQGDERERLIVDWDFCFWVPGSTLEPDQASLKVCDYLSYLLFYETAHCLRVELTATTKGKTFWHVAIERQLVGLD